MRTPPRARRLRPGAVPFWLAPCAQQLLPLLLDGQPDVRHAAAAVLGTLGAQLAAAHAPLPRATPSDPALSPLLLFQFLQHALVAGMGPPHPPPTQAHQVRARVHARSTTRG